MKEKDPEWKERNVFCDGAFEIGDTRFRCWKRGGHGSVGIQEALKASCNVFFYEVGLELGPEKIQKMASRFGLGKKTGFLLGEARGFVPTPKWFKITLYFFSICSCNEHIGIKARLTHTT
jgi:penicillin-binding protein 2